MAKGQLGGTGIAETCTAILALLLLALAVFGGGSEGYIDELFEGDPCQPKPGTAGVCRRAHTCGWLREALRSKDEKIVNCGFEHNVAIVCCPSEEASVKNSSLEVAVKVCERYVEALDFHILSGVKADRGDVPFIAALGYKLESLEPEEGPYKWACGSSLIAPSFLLTAAHCVVSKSYGSPQMVRMGTLNLLTVANDEVQDRTVKHIITHPNYKPSRRYDDIALIEVVSPFLFDQLVKPVCLSTSLEDVDSTQLLLAAGWGQTETRSSSPDALFIANLTTVPIDECGKQFGKVTFGKKKALTHGIRHSQYCAIGEALDELHRSDTCEGDSGGPLYYTADSDVAEKYYQVGITSFGMNCGSSVPSVYTRVTFYLDWIVSHVWPEMEASTR
uniref:Peptidase S1 domain-containing protein n=1 Tax=Anopheles atroparvus TaxID=41427 RepID=A0A182IUU5_ANOAO